MYDSEGQVIGLMKYKRRCEAIQKITTQLCPACRKLVEEALAHK